MASAFAPVAIHRVVVRVAATASKKSDGGAESAFPVSPHKAKLEARRSYKTVRIDQIARPLGKTRANDQEKVKWLMESIADIGLQEPIDVLEVDGKYYGFSGCHRFEAHVKLGRETIECRVLKATRATLQMHLR